MKSKVVIGFLGTQLDAGLGAARWEKWRPTVSLAQHDELQLDRIELLHDVRHTAMAERVAADVLQASPGTVVNLVEMNLSNPWDFGEVYGALYDWTARYPFDAEQEDYWVHITTGTHVAQICLFLLVEARFVPGVLLQSAPPKGRSAREQRAAGSYELIDLDLSRYDAINSRLNARHQDAVSFLKQGIATRNARFNALIGEIENVATQSRAPMLLTGPTGAGKSMLARRIYELKKARHQVDGDFVEVNCATLQGDGAASALFGHKKGAFTGAGADRAGLLRTANGGVLFLDEIGELGLDEQAMLLKAVEDKRFLPMGADKEVSSHFQLIGGTNKDLRREVSAGRFREDLLARINLWTYTLPSLRERPEDIEPNMDHQLALSAQELGRQVRFNLQASASYLRFAQSAQALWRGNFRDLSSSITRMATLAQQGRIDTALVDAEIARLRWQWQSDESDVGEPSQPASTLTALRGPLAPPLDCFDELQLQAVLTVCRQHATLSDAGRQLFNVSRGQRSVLNDADRLRKYLLKFGVTWESLKRGPTA